MCTLRELFRRSIKRPELFRIQRLRFCAGIEPGTNEALPPPLARPMTPRLFHLDSDDLRVNEYEVLRSDLYFGEGQDYLRKRSR